MAKTRGKKTFRQDWAKEAQDELRTRAGLSRRLLRMSELLPDQDRALLEAVFGRGMDAATLARAASTRPHTIRRRVKRIVDRLGSPMFRFVASQREQWPPIRRAVGELVVLQGEAQHRAARTLGISVHRVRQELAGVRALCEQERRRIVAGLDAARSTNSKRRKATGDGDDSRGA